MEVIQWCNDNNGFLTALLSVVSLVISITAIWVSIATARLPYKRKIVLKSNTSIGISKLENTQRYSVKRGMSIMAINVGNRAVKVSILTYATKKNGKYCIINPTDHSFQSKELLAPSEVMEIEYSADELMKLLSKEDKDSILYILAQDTEGNEYKKKLSSVDKFLKNLN